MLNVTFVLPFIQHTSRMFNVVLVKLHTPFNVNAVVIWLVNSMATAVAVKTKPAPNVCLSVKLGFTSDMNPDLAPPLVQVTKIGFLALKDLIWCLFVKHLH